MTFTADRRVDHDEQTFWDDCTDPYGVLLGSTLSGFRSRERADHFAQTAIDSGRHRNVVVLVRDGTERGEHIFKVERRVIQVNGPDRRRLIDHLTEDELARMHDINEMNDNVGCGRTARGTP